MNQKDHSSSRSLNLLALFLLVPAPSLAVVSAMVVEEWRGSLLGMCLFGAAKGWILLMPLLWLRFIDRRSFSGSPVRQGGLGVGLGLGVLTGIVIFGGWWFIGRVWIDPQMLRTAVEGNGIGSPLNYTLFVVFLSLMNALLEEYVWRWFVFERCKVLVGVWPAIIASNFFFMLHHVIALRMQVPWSVTILGSLGVFTGGVVWGWCYVKYRSVWPGYVCHVIADATIFGIGGWMIFG